MKESKATQYEKNLAYNKRLKEITENRSPILKGEYRHDKAMRDALERVKEYRALPSRI